MSIFDRTIAAIERGRNGGNEGLPYGIPSMVPYVPNIQQGTYFLLGGETGSGKTALADYMFMYSPFDYIMNNETDYKMKIIYWSFEISIENKIAKGICQKIYKDHRILVDSNYIFSRGKNRISDEIYDLVFKTREYFDKLHDILMIYDISTNATGVTKEVEKICKSNFVGKQLSEYDWQWTPKDPNLYIINIIDHIGLIRKQKGLLTKKETIDYVSNRLIDYRNKFGLIPVMVSQFNRSLASAERELATKSRPDYNKIRPQLSDFKDSGGTQEDANVVFSMFSPNRYNIPEYNGYHVGHLRDRVRILDCLKSRDGLPDLAKGLGYLGECGLFTDLPNPSDMTDAHYRGIRNLKKYTSTI